MRVSHAVFETPCLHRRHGTILLLQGEVRRLREDKMGGGGAMQPGERRERQGKRLRQSGCGGGDIRQTPREPKDPGVTAGWAASRCSSEGKCTVDNKDGRQNSIAPPNFKEGDIDCDPDQTKPDWSYSY